MTHFVLESMQTQTKLKYLLSITLYTLVHTRCIHTYNLKYADAYEQKIYSGRGSRNFPGKMYRNIIHHGNIVLYIYSIFPDTWKFILYMLDISAESTLRNDIRENHISLFRHATYILYYVCVVVYVFRYCIQINTIFTRESVVIFHRGGSCRN